MGIFDDILGKKGDTRISSKARLQQRAVWRIIDRAGCA